MTRRRRVAWVLLAVWIVVTVAAMTVPLGRMPAVGGRGIDKVIHTGMFTLMGVFGQAAAPWLTLTFTLPLAVATELVQKRLPYRTYDGTELVANIVGLLVGVASYEAATRLAGR